MCLDSFGAEATPILIKALADKRPEIKSLAGRMLAGLGEDAQKAIPALIKMTEDPQDLTRRAALDAILSIDRKGEFVKKTLPVFRRALHDTDKEVQRLGSQGLSQLSRQKPEELKKAGIIVK